MTDLSIHSIVDDFKKGLNLNGLNSVFEFNKELTSEDLIYKAKPEEYTKIRLIRPILELLECDLDDAELVTRDKHMEVRQYFSRQIGEEYALTDTDLWSLPNYGRLLFYCRRHFPEIRKIDIKRILC